MDGNCGAAFYRVYDRLGFGFLESVYRNAFAKELQKAGIAFEREVSVDVWYDGEQIGHFRADFLIENKTIVEVKASQCLVEADRKQLLNYLRGSKVSSLGSMEAAFVTPRDKRFRDSPLSDGIARAR